MGDIVLGKYVGVKVPADLSGNEKDDYLIKAIVRDSKVEVPKASIEERAQSMAQDYALRLIQQGLSIEQYYQVSGTDEKALLKKMKEQAKIQLEGRKILEMIAKRENIIVTEEDFEAEIEKLTIRYPLGKDQIKKILKGQEEQRLRNDILIKKSMDFVREHAVKETEPSG